MFLVSHKMSNPSKSILWRPNSEPTHRAMSDSVIQMSGWGTTGRELLRLLLGLYHKIC